MKVKEFNDYERHCFNCVHCEEHLAYEKCSLRIRDSIIYNGTKEAMRCNHYKQKEVKD